MNRLKNLLLVASVVVFCEHAIFGSTSFGSTSKIKDVIIEGNRKVEKEAFQSILKSKTGEIYNPKTIEQDIYELDKLGFFSKIKFSKEDSGNETTLYIEVEEKPAITEIVYKGLHEFKESDFTDILATKLYSIVDEAQISDDLIAIEKKYADKGYFLVSVSYDLEKKEENERKLVFNINENAKLEVGDVFFVGNHFFTDRDLLDFLTLQPITRTNSLFSSSIYKEDSLDRDKEVINFLYRDKGFADVKVEVSSSIMDVDKKYIRLTHNIEEGIQYSVGKLSVSGDIGPELYTEDFLLKKMKLISADLFRYSRFAQDVEMLIDQYGDLGYAYVDVNPLTKFNKETKLVDIEYQIVKGKKVYFGEMIISGNIKTRFNVIMREFEIHDSELYSGTKLTETKKNINRLGFFEDVKVLKERDKENEDVLNLNFKVKEKPTGQLSASVGFSPGGETKASWFGQGRYDEKNQSGRAWNTNLTIKYGGSEEQSYEIGLLDPKVYDSPWSLGLGASYDIQQTRYATGVEIPEKRMTGRLTVGRDLFELVRAFSTYRYRIIHQDKKAFVFNDYQSGGIERSFTLGLTRKSLDNYLDPSDGSEVSVSTRFVGGLFGGDYNYMENSFDGDYYVPLEFSERFRTYFKFHAFLGILSPIAGQKIPTTERYRLGGFNNLRGYGFWDVGPKDKRSRSPLGLLVDYNIGGNKQMFYQVEYFVPLIPQVGIKSLLFFDIGRVYLEEEDFSFQKMSADFGFGFRWMTPIAPFRFEWAYPYDVEQGKIGEMKFIFTLGM